MQSTDRERKSGSRTTLEPQPIPHKVNHKSNARELSPRHLSPLRLLIILIGGIFLAEVAAMGVVYFWRPASYLRLTLIDAGIMTVLIFPLLYFLSFRPLLLYIEKSRQAEETLLGSLELQERFFDSIDTLIAYMDRDFNFIRVNEAYAKADGKQPDYFIGRNHFELFPHAENRAIFQRVVETGKAYSVYEKPFEYPDHPERGITYWNWSLLPVRGADKRVDGLVLSMVDVTERVRAEQENRQLSRIVEQTADTVVVTDCDGVIEYVNPAFEEMTGYTMEEALGQTPRILKSDLHDTPFYQNLWNTILNGKVFYSEIANRKKDGELYYEVKTITPLRDELGDITHFVATGKDISAHKRAEKELKKAYDELELRVHARTEELRIANSELEEEILERKRAEEAIMESEEKYRSLFDNMSEGFGLHEIILDAGRNPCDYRFLELNAAFERLTGLSREKILGRTVQEVLPDIEPLWIETFGKVTLTGEPVHFTNFSAPLGKYYEIYCYSPKQNLFATVFFDVTERVRAENALRESEARLAYLASFPEQNPNPVMEVDFDGQVRYANPAALRIFPDLGEQALTHAWLADWKTTVVPFRDGKTKSILRDLIVEDRFYQQLLYPIVANSLVRIYGVDITERKQAEAEIQQAVEEVRAANEELKRFNTLMVGRELRMIELKKEVNELCASAKQPQRYPLDFVKEGR